MSYSEDYMGYDLPQEEEEAPSNIRVAKNIYRKQLAKKIVVIFGYAALVVVVIYACFAATIIRVIPATNGVGLTPVKEHTFSGGQAPPGSRLVVNPNATVGDGGLDRLLQGFKPTSDVALVDVHSGPFGKVSWQPDGRVLIDGDDSGLKMSRSSVEEDKADKVIEFSLNDEYLVECVEGDCTVGLGLIISMDNVYGVPFKLITNTKDTNTKD